MEEPEHKLLIIGLPDSGKTSFLHAIDDLLQDPPSDSSLRAYGLAAERGYIERDKEKFRAGEKFERTERNLDGPHPELLFEDPATKLRGRVIIPDLSGEIFREQWVNRVWENTYRDDLKEISGALLFVRADEQASNTEMLGDMIKKFPAGGSPQPWDPKNASQQVQVVEVLQFISTYGALNSLPLRVAVMISAYDVVLKPEYPKSKNPDDFLAAEWALLDQFLHANPEYFLAKVYGVSARGGTFEELKELSKLPPAERVSLADGNVVSRDLTQPLRWLLGLT